jgi:hypothetical protein
MLVQASTADPQAAVAAFTAKEFWPVGCSTSTVDTTNPMAVHVHLSECDGPFGIAHFTGDLVVTFSQGTTGSLHMHAETSTLRVGEHAASWTRDADVDVVGDLRTVTGTSTWSHTNDRGEVTSHTAQYSIAIDGAAGCRTLDGTATTAFDHRAVTSAFNGYQICRVAGAEGASLVEGPIGSTGKSLAGSASAVSPDGCPRGIVTSTFGSPRSGDVVTLSFGDSSSAATSPGAIEPVYGCGATSVTTAQEVHNAIPVVHDPVWHVSWLANANLAATQSYGLPVNPNGTMDYKTACLWVQHLNADPTYRLSGPSSHWQLPVTPHVDASCGSTGPGNPGCSSQPSGMNSFGINCSGSPVGNLFYNRLARLIAAANGGFVYSGSVAPSGMSNAMSPFTNLQPSLYWAYSNDLDSNNRGSAQSFTFGIDSTFGNTISDNFLHVLPMVRGFIGSPPAPEPGNGLVLYRNGKAVYDSDTGCTWAANANLAASNAFGFSGMTTVVKGTTTVPMISASGTMLWTLTGGFLDEMSAARYAGSSSWTLPEYNAAPSSGCTETGPCSCSDLATLFDHLKKQAKLQVGDQRLAVTAAFGPFQNLQPFLYWECAQDPNDPSSQAQCSAEPAGYSNSCVPMRFSFNFDSGFQGSAEETKQLNVMVYWPDTPSATSPPDCSTLE